MYIYSCTDAVFYQMLCTGWYTGRLEFRSFMSGTPPNQNSLARAETPTAPWQTSVEATLLARGRVCCVQDDGRRVLFCFAQQPLQMSQSWSPFSWLLIWIFPPPLGNGFWRGRSRKRANKPGRPSHRSLNSHHAERQSAESRFTLCESSGSAGRRNLQNFRELDGYCKSR